MTAASTAREALIVLYAMHCSIFLVIGRRRYILLVDIKGVVMSNTGVAKIFMHGRSQAVRLPLAFRLPGERVRVRRVANGILLEPMVTNIDAWFAELDRFADVPFMEGGRRQPPMPASEDLFA